MCSSTPKFNEIRFCLGRKILRRRFQDYTDLSWELVVKYLENVLTWFRWLKTNFYLLLISSHPLCKLCSGFFLRWLKTITTNTLGLLVTNYYWKCFSLIGNAVVFFSLIRAVMATSRLIYRVFAVLAVLDVVTLAYVQGRQAAFRTP